MFDFPDTPSNGQLLTGPGGVQYRWDGGKWVSGSASGAYLPLTGGTLTGALTPSAGITALSKSGAPTTTEIPASTYRVVKDTTGGTVKLFYNDAGTLKSVALV